MEVIVHEYHIVRAGRNAELAEVHGPVDAMGEPFPDFQKVDPRAHGTCDCVDKRTRLADCVYCITDLIISQRAAEVFEKFLVPEGTTFLPVDVCARNGKPLAKLVAVMMPEIVEALDLAASKFKELTKGTPHYFTEPPVLRAAALGGLDLLMCLWVPSYLCSGRLRREIEKEELTNFAFEPVVVK
jgi:hypothetical protein